MKCGVIIHPTNLKDWERYFAADWDRPQETPDWVLWDEALQLVDLVEPLGFDKIWTTEHRATPYGQIPNPMSFLAHAAGRTKTIGVGTNVIVVPWWKTPLRAAEEISLLDNLLQGRELTVGFGRGVAEPEFAAVNIDRDESRGRFAEGIRLIREALSKPRFSWDGEYFHVGETTVYPHLRNPEVVTNMVGAFSGRDSLDVVADIGIGMTVTAGKSPAAIREDVIRFNERRALNGLEPTQPLITLIAYCSKDKNAEEDAMRHFKNYSQDVTWHYKFADADSFRGVKGYEAYLEAALTNNRDGFRAYDMMFGGSPDQIVAQLQEVQQQTGAREFIINFALAGMPLEVAARSLTTFAEEVLPAIKEMEAPLPEWSAANA